MSKKFTDFYEAWNYLNNCKVFKVCDSSFIQGVKGKIILEDSYFYNSLTIEVVKVNPETMRIDDTKERNTKTQIWLECGEPYYEDGHIFWNNHNPDYDVGGDTFEQAIIKMANKVYKKNKG